MRLWAIGLSALALSPVLSGQVLAALPMPLRWAIQSSPIVRAAVSGAEERAQLARDAQAKVERNRRCRPSAEKSYAVAVDDCRKSIGPEQAGDRQRCFSEARSQYFRSLSDCPG
jgi:hypothetical protein